MEERDFRYFVEVFDNGEYSHCFSSKTIKQVYTEILVKDSKTLKDLKYSYLIFRENPSGNLVSILGRRFYLASALNHCGKEEPHYLSVV